MIDSLLIRILKMAATEITDSLTKLFNVNLTEGVYPTDWKKANVYP